MVATKSILALVAAFSTANAVVVNYYSDENCQNQVNQRNVFDNSCATGIGGYSSFLIVTGPTDSGQQVTAWSRDACAGDTTACIPGVNLNQCTRSTNGAGASNAMSSSPNCGTV